MLCRVCRVVGLSIKKRPISCSLPAKNWVPVSWWQYQPLPICAFYIGHLNAALHIELFVSWQLMLLCALCTPAQLKWFNGCNQNVLWRTQNLLCSILGFTRMYLFLYPTSRLKPHTHTYHISSLYTLNSLVEYLRTSFCFADDSMNVMFHSWANFFPISNGTTLDERKNRSQNENTVTQLIAL